MAAKSNQLVDIDPEKVRAIVKDLRAMPDRLDKEMRKELREISKKLVEPARADARAARPQRTTPKITEGKYHWATLVNTIRSGADSDTPYMVVGSDRVPGWPGWVFGSTKYPQFPPRLPRNGRGNEGYFFFPTIDKAADTIEDDVKHVVDKYARIAEGE